MRRLGKSVKSNHKGYFCELLDGNGEVIGYAAFSSDGVHIKDCKTLAEAENLLDTWDNPPGPSGPGN